MPLHLLLMKYHDAQVTLCHSRTPKEEMIKCIGEADILVACIGIPNFVRPEWLREGQIVIDVGITYDDVDKDLRDKMTAKDRPQQEKEIFGDVYFSEETVQKVSLITPVPGGIGPMTITMLLNNLE